MKNITTKKKETKMQNNNFEICYTSDCCGEYVHSDAQICPACLEHCEVVEDCTVYDDCESVHFDSMLDFYGAG